MCPGIKERIEEENEAFFVFVFMFVCFSKDI